jgi:hypothetical protein
MTIFCFFALSNGKTGVFPIDIEGPLWHNPKFMVGNLKEKIQEK